MVPMKCRIFGGEFEVRVRMKDSSICVDYRRCSPRGVTFVAEAGGRGSRERLCFVSNIHGCGCASSEAKYILVLQ
jgi:hypothetical protein